MSEEGTERSTTESKHLEAIQKINEHIPEFKNFARGMTEKEWMELARLLYRILS